MGMQLRAKTTIMKLNRLFIFLVIALISATVFFINRGVTHSSKSHELVNSKPSQPTLEQFLSIKPGEIEIYSVTAINLLCAEGLRGAERLDLTEAEQMVKRIAARVAAETLKNFHQFRQTPQQFENSEAYFRILVLAMVLHEDFKVRYNPAKITNAGVFESNASFFGNSQDVFIHGLLFGEHMGTCSSMPVFYIAVGRELGYPLKLVTAKNHLFIRWEDAKERRNFETTGNGLNSFDDNYYRSWPLPISEKEEMVRSHLPNSTGRLNWNSSLQKFSVTVSGESKTTLDPFATPAL